MIGQFILWAQALDNTSPGHIEVQGEELSGDDTARRQAAASSVSEVGRAGSRIFDEQGCRLTEDGSHFAAEVLCVERDVAGRDAPIVCHGTYDSIVGEALVQAVIDATDGFAKRVGRTIRPGQFELLRKAFETLKKKSLIRKRRIVFGVVVAFGGLFSLIYWLLLIS
ncbi:MAG: hypothetical protein ACI96M_000405 [Candidatus Azotimanducaceae bacterium]|jgi:hypothetical protein